MRVADEQAVRAKTLGAQPRKLRLGGLAAKPQRPRGDGTVRRTRPVGPQIVDRVGLDRCEFGAQPSAKLREALNEIVGVIPGIEAEPIAWTKVFLQPVLRRFLAGGAAVKDAAIGLRGRLNRVAAVDEQGGFVLQDDRKAGRAGKARRPEEPLLVGRQIFILVPIGARNDETGKPLRGEACAQSGDALADRGRATQVGEGLMFCRKRCRHQFLE